jgi:cellulose synthase/poly-beta-1,6-N-acetylglucosamine synthase-like glycosyltransferase
VTGLFVFYLAASLLYGLFIFWLGLGLNRNRRRSYSSDQPFVSVIIPARNEEANIGQCLADLSEQSYPADRYEIVVVDDDSQDRTAEIVQTFARVRYFVLDRLPEGWSPKKAALTFAIQHSQGAIILTTDADSRLPQHWIESMVSHFDAGVAAVASWVLLADSKRLLTRLERLDMLALQTVGAAAMGHGAPFLANGANWGYRRTDFEAVKGFDGHETMASGDDDLLLQKIHRHGSRRCVFADQKQSCVITAPCSSWREFFMQRLRWASKTSLYPLSVRLLELFIFLYFFSLLLLPLLLRDRPYWGLFLLCKFICDLVLMRRTASALSVRVRWYDVLLAGWWQIAYITVVALAAWRGRFVWKGREYVQGRRPCQEKGLKRAL